MPVQLTGARAERFAELKAVRVFLPPGAYMKAKKKLEDQQKIANEKAEAAIARREAAVAQRKEAKRIAKAEIARQKREAKKALKTDILARITIPVGSTLDSAEVYEVATRIHTLNPPSFRLRLFVNGTLYKTKESNLFTELRNFRVSRIHEAIRSFYQWTYDSPTIFTTDDDLVEWDPSTRLEIIISSASKPLIKKRMKQAFANGAVHCVADPLASMWERYAANSLSEESKKKALRTAKQIRAYGEQYPNGIPEGEEMETIAKMAQRRVVITDVLDNTYLEYNVKSTKSFYLLNAVENHVQQGHIAIGGKPEKVSQARMDELLQEHKDRYLKYNEFFMFDGINNNERCIRSTKGAWRVQNPMHEIYENHNKENNIESFGIDAIKFPEVNAFLKKAALINSVPVKLSDAIPTKHHDLKAAYTQHKMTSRFEGIMGAVHQWRNVSNNTPENVLQHLSICEFEVLENNHPLLLKLGLVVGSIQILPSPEIKLFMDMGVKVKLMNAVFGSKTDIKYGEEIMEYKDKDKNKAYATWAGCLSHDKAKKEYNFKGSKEWANHLASIYGLENVRFNNKNDITILVPKKTNYTKHHILAFITSYTRINMIEALLTLKTPCYVVLDGIYHADESVNLPAEFRIKPMTSHKYFSDGWYTGHSKSADFPPCDLDLLKNCVLAGQGGCGKTYSIMTDKGFNNILYVVPQHMLGKDICKKYGAYYTTIHKLIGEDCVPYSSDHVAPSVCLIDEMTMISADWIKKAVAMYKNTLFFVAGDVEQTEAGRLWFQCRNGKPGQFSEIWDGAGFNLKTFTNDRRSKDDQLKTLKLRLREEMVHVFTDGGHEDAQRIGDWVAKHYNVVYYNRAYKMVSPGDTWIAGTHRTNARLLANNIITGYLSKNNEKSVEPVEGWEKRGSFTTHSFQGQTIEDGKVFISINDAFEYAMIYTAVSRATHFDQIVFVD